MSTDTPRPERVTLTDEDEAWDALADDSEIICTCDGCNFYSPTYDSARECNLTARVKAILAAREQALRERAEKAEATVRTLARTLDHAQEAMIAAAGGREAVLDGPEVDWDEVYARLHTAREALARMEALADEWERDWDGAVDRGQADTGFAARKGAARRIRAALRGETR